MEKLSTFVKTADWQNEKHVPVINAPEKIKAGEWTQITVTVGKEIPHPNNSLHYIAWIALHFVPEGSNVSVEIARCEFSAHGLSASGPDQGAAYAGSSAIIPVKLMKPGVLHATAYCNIHGLWTSSAAVAVE